MIFGIGHDLVENSRIEGLVLKYQTKFALKILTKPEYQIYLKHNNPIRFLAKRFAAKEAFAKACGTGVRAPILLNKVGVVNDDLGAPKLELSPAIIDWLKIRKIISWHVSLSDEELFSSAIVVLET